MAATYNPTHSETLVFIGAGATTILDMPSTYDQTQIFRNLSEAQSVSQKEAFLSKYFSSSDLEKIIAFLNLLDGTEENIFEVSEKDLENARIVYGNHDETILRNRILELRSEYDWNAAKKIIRICPNKANEYKDDLILNLYSIIDKKLLSRQSLKVQNEEILPPNRLQGARNFLILFVNMMFASAWYKITQREKSEEFDKYRKFINSFDQLMQKEGMQFIQRGKKVHHRDFYLFSTSFVSFNFEMVFPWIFMNSHHNMNHQPPYIQDHPLKLWLDYGVEHRGRKLEGDRIEPTLEFTESVASRENEDDHIGTPLNRAGKFYFAHGSANWRECPVCGRMTFYFGASKNKWNYKSNELIPPFPIPLFETEKVIRLTQKEEEYRKSLHYDSLQCMHCGSETKALDAPMIMQTMYKSTPTSFLEEIQRNVKVNLEKARHIVLFGYQLPPDDIIWQHAFAEAICPNTESDKTAYCSVVVGYRGEKRWLYKDELLSFVEAHRKDDNSADWGVNAIENSWAIFGKDKVRAWTGGIPQVFGNCTESDVEALFYPDFVKWNGTRLEK